MAIANLVSYDPTLKTVTVAGDISSESLLNVVNQTRGKDLFVVGQTPLTNRVFSGGNTTFTFDTNTSGDSASDVLAVRYQSTSSNSIDLTAPSTNIGTVTPPSITVSTLFRSGNSGNVPFIAQPSGTGAFQLQPTDNTVVGGNARGANAIDLQKTRSAASRVASGLSSFLVGAENTASGLYSVAIGNGNAAIGYNAICIGESNTVGGNRSVALCNLNTVDGNNAFAAGYLNAASGSNSIALGFGAMAKSVDSLFILGSRTFNAIGKSQSTELGVGGETTTATPTILKSNIEVASATNQLVLQNNSSLTFTALVTATTTAGGDCSSWEFRGMIQRGSNAASTALVGVVTPVLIAQKAGAATWGVAVTADTVNGCLAVTVTGQAFTTIRWNCSIFATEVAF